MSRSLWEQSGHWDNYGDNMYTTTIEDREYAIKPMNCPGSILYYNSHMHSYRDLPVRISEIGTVHRVENSGSISGLLCTLFPLPMPMYTLVQIKSKTRLSQNLI